MDGITDSRDGNAYNVLEIEDRRRRSYDNINAGMNK